MTVERKEDGSIYIKNNNDVAVIGAVVGTISLRQEERFQQWVEHCANVVTANPHTLKETEQYFLEQCDVLPLDNNDRNMKGFQLNLIMNYCKEKLEHRPSDFTFDMTNEEIEKWHQEDKAMRKEVMNSSAEHFGLIMRGYYLPHTERNNVFYEETYLEVQKSMKRTNTNINPSPIEMQDICFFFEETTEQIQSSGGGKSLMQQLIAFRGVSNDDIKKRNPRFLGYISALRDIGRLSDF